MEQATTQEGGKYGRSITVTFQSFAQAVHTGDVGAVSPVLDGEASMEVPAMGYDREAAEGDIDAALEVIHSSPNDVDAHEVADALGETLVAVIEAEERTVVATNMEYDASEAPSQQNPPATAGDVVPSEVGIPIQMVDHPTGGPLFRNPDGEHIQHDNFDFLIE